MNSGCNATECGNVKVYEYFVMALCVIAEHDQKGLTLPPSGQRWKLLDKNDKSWDKTLYSGPRFFLFCLNVSFFNHIYLFFFCNPGSDESGCFWGDFSENNGIGLFWSRYNNIKITEHFVFSALNRSTHFHLTDILCYYVYTVKG